MLLCIRFKSEEKNFLKNFEWLWSVILIFSQLCFHQRETMRVTTSARFHRILFSQKHNFCNECDGEGRMRKIKSDLSLFETFSLLDSLAPLSLSLSHNVRGHFICPCTAEYNKQLKCTIRDNVMPVHWISFSISPMRFAIVFFLLIQLCRFSVRSQH